MPKRVNIFVDKGSEKAWPRPAVCDKDGEYSYIITECQNLMYCVNGSYMRYDNAICPRCGKVIHVDTSLIHANLSYRQTI